MKSTLDNVKDQIGFCGIWCGSCVVGNGALAELTRRYQGVIADYGLQEWASEGIDFAEFKRGLDCIQEVASCEGCLKGGGKTDCELRDCAQDRNVTGCFACDFFESCQNADLLAMMRDGARDAGLMVRKSGENRQEFMKRGFNELKKQFPGCILFISDS